MDPQDDLQPLIDRARAGDVEAAGKLFEVVQEPVLRWVRARISDPLRRREESLDLVQTGIRQALAGLERFEWQGPGSFHRWLCRVVEHQMARHARYWMAAQRDAREVPIECDPLSGESARSARAAPEVDEPGPRTRVLEGEQRELLREGVRGLPENERSVVDLSLQGLSDSEIAERLEMSKSAVQRARATAVRKLSLRMRSKCEEGREE
jgi:RNA polymerase sigma factor (sigma-70 family)